MTPIHNHHKNSLKVFTTLGKNNAIIRRAYIGDQHFSRVKSCIFLFIIPYYYYYYYKTIFTPIYTKIPLHNYFVFELTIFHVPIYYFISSKV
jgi:hypothetical protein